MIETNINLNILGENKNNNDNKNHDLELLNQRVSILEKENSELKGKVNMLSTQIFSLQKQMCLFLTQFQSLTMSKALMNQPKQNEKKFVLEGLNSDILNQFVHQQILGKILMEISPSNYSKLKANLLYKVKQDGDKSENFYSKCAGKAPTLILVKTTKGRKFGAFTTQKWDDKPKDECKADPKAFIFSIERISLYKSSIPENAVFSFDFPAFGYLNDCCDLAIYNNCLTTESEDFTPRVFKTKERYELAGEKLFLVQDLEIYEIVQSE